MLPNSGREFGVLRTFTRRPDLDVELNRIDAFDTNELIKGLLYLKGQIHMLGLWNKKIKFHLIDLQKACVVWNHVDTIVKAEEIVVVAEVSVAEDISRKGFVVLDRCLVNKPSAGELKILNEKAETIGQGEV